MLTCEHGHDCVVVWNEEACPLCTAEALVKKYEQDLSDQERELAEVRDRLTKIGDLSHAPTLSPEPQRCGRCGGLGTVPAPVGSTPLNNPCPVCCGTGKG